MSGSPEAAQDAARSVAVILAVSLAAVFGVLLLAKLMAVMPFGLWLLLAVCVTVGVVAAAWALFARAFSTPPTYHPGPPKLKPRRLSPIRSQNGHVPPEAVEPTPSPGEQR